MAPKLKLSLDQQQRLVDLYGGGWTARQLALEFGINAHTVMRYLDRAGAKRSSNRRGPNFIVEERKQHFIRLYGEGWTATDIAKEYGCDTSTVAHHLRAAGVPVDSSRRGSATSKRRVEVALRGCRNCGSSKAIVNGRCAECTREYNRIYNITRNMGITVERYEECLNKQGGTCAICRIPGKRLAMDHDHSCCPGRRACGDCFRGLLCTRCNRALGVIGDRNIERAFEYLRRT